MGKMERKFGKYAIRNLSLILIICYAFGYLLSMIPAASSLLDYLTLNPALILRGQIWRLFTWVIVPPSMFTLGTLITLFFYYSIGRSLERTWGDWLYNVYIFSGMLFTVIGAFIMFGILILEAGSFEIASLYMSQYAFFFSTYYINMSIFLAFAATFPDAQVLLMFIIPIRVKWLGFIYAAFLVYEFLAYNWIMKIVIGLSLLNFIVFFLVQRKRRFGSPKYRMQQAKRRHEFNQNIRADAGPSRQSISKHKCAICGRTELEYPDLEFRFCSKCNGNYEYCSDHLFTHKHVE